MAIKARSCSSCFSREASSSRSLSFRSFSKRRCSSRKRSVMVSTPLELKTLDGVQGIADKVPKSGAMEEQASQMKPFPSRLISAWAYWISDFWLTFGGVTSAGCTPEGPSQDDKYLVKCGKPILISRSLYIIGPTMSFSPDSSLWARESCKNRSAWHLGTINPV